MRRLRSSYQNKKSKLAKKKHLQNLVRSTGILDSIQLLLSLSRNWIKGNFELVSVGGIIGEFGFDRFWKFGGLHEVGFI